MITDNILGNDKIENRSLYKPSRKPILVEFKERYYRLDPELKKLRHVLIKDTVDNREYCFWSDSISQTIVTMISSMTTGTGLRIASTNTRAREIIREWNEEINVNRKSIEDYYLHSWIDEIIYADSYWRAERTKEMSTNIDIQRIDPKTITIRKDYKYGWEKLIQSVPDYKSYRSKKKFYREASANEIDNSLRAQIKEIHIPDEPSILLRTNFFIRPPISSALHYISYKRYILYFMRKFSQKFWLPFILFLVGDPKTNYYPEDDEMQEQINDIAEIVPKISNFGSAVFPGNVRIEEVGKQTAKSSEIYTTYVEALDRQIAISLYYSMGLMEARGNELSTQRSIKESTMQFIQGIRKRYKNKLETFYVKCLLPANGIKLTRKDIEILYPPLKFEASEEYMRAVELGRRTGLFVDRNELRKAAQSVWNWLEPVDEKLNEKINFQTPVSTGMGSSLFGGTRSKEQDTRQKVKSLTSTTNI